MIGTRATRPRSVAAGIASAVAVLLGGGACTPPAAPDDTVTVRSALSTVLVTVVDQAGVPQFDFPVMAMRNSGSVEAEAWTNANGQASLSLTANPFRFATEEGGIEFYSGAVGHCVTPGCTTATITLSRVDLLVADTNGAPQEGLTVWWETPEGEGGGYNGTGADGHALITTPPGSYRFVTNVLGLDFYSGAEGHCTVPGCTSATITTQVPVTVTVRDTTGAPLPNQLVYAYSTTDEYSGFVDTDANGVALLFVPEGAHQFYTELANNDYSSGPPGHCVIPGCTSASITVAAPVTVTVTDTGGAPIVGRPVFWRNVDNNEGGGVNTNASGVATVRPPLEPVRFRVTVDGTQFFSDTTLHCSQPGCTAASISVSQQTVVTVVNSGGAPLSGIVVRPLSDEGIGSADKTTNASGQATFRLPFAHWRFRGRCGGSTEEFFSGNAGHCFIPGGCLTARITMVCGTCVGQANGTACNDANPCTGTSTCQNQRCTGASPVSCSASDQCHDAGACGAETGTAVCSNPPKANGASCSDGNGCTQTDTCQAGACVGANPVVCPPPDQCHDAGTCVSGTGACAYPAKANGTSCSDGNACTQTDACQAGACVGANPITCPAQDQCHVAGTCHPATGICSASPPAANGTACNDGNRCSVSDSCQAGTCLPGPATGCSAGQPQYVSVIDLGSAQLASFATGINNGGVVAGTETPNGSIYQLGYPGTKGFRWSESGGKVYLPWTGAQSYAVDINDAGVMSVTAGVDPWVMLPCRYDPAVDTQPVCHNSAGNAFGINAGGTLTGSSYYPDGAVSMFRLGTGAIEILPPASGSDSRAKGVAIADDGTVVGNQFEGEGLLGVRYTGTRGAEWLVDLLPAGSGWSSANPSSVRAGQILGWGMRDGHGRAFRMRTAANGDVTEIVALPVPSTYSPDAANITIAAEANASGEIVGSVYDGIPYWPQAAFVYTDATGSVDLNTLIDPQSGWQLIAGFAINDNHQVVGYGLHDGANHAFKLTLPNLSPCPPADSCHTQGPRDLLTGVCPPPVTKPNGAPCDDGSACTIADACNAGVCQGATTVACTAPDACHAAGTCNTNAAPPPPPSTQDLIGWWRMEGNGDDASGGGHPLTNEGATAAPGRVGQGMKFDGTACMTAPIWEEARMQGASGVTVMAWLSPSQEIVCPTAPSQGMTVVGRGWDYSIGSKCDFATPHVSAVPGLRLAGVQNWGYGSGWGGIYPNDWVHAAFTWEGGVWRFYYNGQQVQSGIAQGALGDIDPTFAVGCMVSWLFTENQRIQNFKGTIDEVMLYRRALTAAEIGTYYTAADPCTHPPVADGTTCSDSNACTQTDTCQTGTCVGANPVACAAPDTCHTAGTCSPSTGVCSYPARPDGTACDDGSACTRGDTCNLGVCQGPTTVTCSAPDSCHEAGTCNAVAPAPQPPSTQDLVGWWRLDGDGVDASGGGHDLTNEGAVPAPGRVGLGMRFDGESCMTAPVWNEARMQGASGMTIMAWVNPSDQIVCPLPMHGMTIAGRGWDYSMGAHCYSPSPDVGLTGSVRTVEAFPIGWGYPGGWGGGFPNQWIHVAITWDHLRTRIYINGQDRISYPVEGAFGDVESTFAVGCLIAHYWTLDERIQNFKGTLDEVMLYRRQLSPAEIWAYYGASDPCVHPPVADGTTCNDGNACTQTDSCQTGTCVGANPIVCTADQCHVAGACVAGTCPTPAPRPDGAACNDGNACTRADVCAAGACVGANPVVCLAPDSCHTASCDTATGACSAAVVGGTCSLGAFDYDKAGRLIRDRSAELKYDAYDQLREVLPTASPPPITNLAVEELVVPGATSTTTGHSNSKGQVPVGGVMPSGVARTLLFKGVGAVEDLNATLGISTNLFANSMNDAGAVAGSWQNTLNGANRAFRYDATGFHDLGNPGDFTIAYDLNNANQVVGFTATGAINSGYRHTDGVGFEGIGTFGGAQSWAWRIDDLGIVSASAQLPDSPSTGPAHFGHAALYHDIIGLQDLNALLDPMAGTTLTIANERRGEWVVGAGLVGDVQRAYRLNLSTHALDEIGWAGSSIANSVNAAGDVVGWGYLDAGDTQQAAWILSQRTGFAKLNDLIDPASGWDLRVCTGIDDFGVIVGWGYRNGVISAFRLRVPAHSSGTGGPMVAEVHTYGYDGLRTSTTTAPGTTNASTQVWFSQNYSEHGGKREHYVRLGDRIVAKVTLQPPMGGGGGGMGALIDPRHPPIDLGDLVAKVLLATLLASGVAATGAGVIGRKRRPRWIGATAGSTLLFFLASCEQMGTDRRSAATVWQRIEVVYLHQGLAKGPVLSTKADGNLHEERRHEPFGQPIDANLSGTMGPVDLRREQQNSLGKLTNPNTGWSYHGARWMQPQAGRWISPDPATKGPTPTQLSQFWSLNPYAYVNQNPALLWDPNGAESFFLHTPDGERPIPDLSGQMLRRSNPLQPLTVDETSSLPDYGEITVNSLVLAAFEPVFLVLWAADPNGGPKVEAMRQSLRPFPYSESNIAAGTAMESTFQIMFSIGFGLARSADKVVALAALERRVAISAFEPGTVPTRAVRVWYREALANLHSRIPANLGLKERALEAFRLRNEIKMQARSLMADRGLAERLPPARSLESVVKRAHEKGYQGNGVWEYIYDAATRSDPATDAVFGMAQ